MIFGSMRERALMASAIPSSGYPQRVLREKPQNNDIIIEEEDGSKDVEHILSSSVSGASSLVLLQLISFRCALLRSGNTVINNGDDDIKNESSSNSSSGEKVVLVNSRKGSMQKIINLSYIPIPIGIIITFLVCAFQIFYATEETFATPYFITSVILYGLAAFGELLIEPLYIIAMNNLIYKLRVGCEGIGVIVRCLITLGLTILGVHKIDNDNEDNKYGILAFAIAQFTYTLILMVGYIGYFLYYWNIGLLIPRKLQDESNPEDQGIYAFVVNYGSLIVRILFQPLEETAKKTSLVMSLKILTTLIKFHILLGLIFIGLATNYTGALIDILVGSMWSQSPAPLALSFYCLYVPIMGINGITEAFVAAVATKETLNTLNYWLIAFSAGFVGNGIIFMKILSAGAIGLVAANALNLLTRILWSWKFIKTYFLKDRGASKKDLEELQQMLIISNLTPKPLIWISFMISWGITFWSNQYIGWNTLDAKIKHIGIGIFCAVFVSEMAKHHPDLIMCRKQPGIAIGRLCEKCDGKCTPLFGRCVICGAPGVSDAYYCKECVLQEKDIVNLGSSKTDLFYERKKYGFKKR
ncbi:7220_t:CDS:10 [Diversispora eburnea]|uniref:Man(5)GlcNAc(2)-PP-dolichol translocation protein RFT1 n=1 Tax=Diversispora eburnea TaxID=1213867 RepID=A0A9N8V596_9GLOM|nr:7220_t:CDS:10 [Diversispora eburnea]